MRNNDKIEIIWRIIASQLLELIRKRCWHPRGAGFVSLVGAVDQNSFAVDFAVGAISVLAVAHVEHSHVHSSKDRKSVVYGKSVSVRVDLCGHRTLKKIITH